MIFHADLAEKIITGEETLARIDDLLALERADSNVDSTRENA
jgi:hypothetical protein